MLRPLSQQSMYRVPSYMRTNSTVPATARERIASVPREFLIRDLKEKRQFRLLSRKLTVFVTFVSVYLVVLILDRNIAGRSVVRRIISNDLLFVSQAASGITFARINGFASFWDWFINSFLVLVYQTHDSAGFPRHSEELYTIASHNTIVGGFHIQQTRYAAVTDVQADSIRGDQCYSKLVPVQGHLCFTAAADSTAPFGPAIDTATNSSSSGSLSTQTEFSMFEYRSEDGMNGYHAYFLRSANNGSDEQQRAETMRVNRWLDRQTKLVQITMPLYNRNLKLWSIVHLTIDFDLAGGVKPLAFIHVTNLEPYDLTNRRNVLRGALEIVFVAHVIYFLLLELWDVCVLSSGNLVIYIARYGLMNNIGDWANILVNLAICTWRYFCQSNAVRQRLLALETFDEYVPALSLARWDEILLAMNICNMLLLTGRTLKYFQITGGGRRLMYSVYGAMPEVMSFLPIYCSVIIGYTFAGHLLYGLSFPEWSTFAGAFFRVFEMNFGLYDPGPIYDAGGYLSAIYIYSSSVVFCILMLNVFMAIVMSTWEQLTEKEAAKDQERANYSRTLSPTELMHMILLSEDIVDVLIEVAMDMDDKESVTKKEFTAQWQKSGFEVSPATWERVTNWYWDATIQRKHDPDSEDVDKKGERAASRLPLPPVKDVFHSEATDDLVTVVKTPRELDGVDNAMAMENERPKAIRTETKAKWWKASPPTSKVGADLS